MKLLIKLLIVIAVILFLFSIFSLLFNYNEGFRLFAEDKLYINFYSKYFYEEEEVYYTISDEYEFNINEELYEEAVNYYWEEYPKEMVICLKLKINYTEKKGEIIGFKRAKNVINGKTFVYYNCDNMPSIHSHPNGGGIPSIKDYDSMDLEVFNGLIYQLNDKIRIRMYDKEHNLYNVKIAN